MTHAFHAPWLPLKRWSAIVRDLSAGAIALGLAASGAQTTSAHTTSTGLAAVQVDGKRITYSLTVNLAELPEEPAARIRRATDGDEEAATQIAVLLRERVQFSVDGSPCPPARFRLQGTRMGDDRAILHHSVTCPHAPGRLQISDSLSVPFGEHYRTIASILGPGGFREERVFLPGAVSATFDLKHPSAQGWSGFFMLGIEHILTGYDHLLFLLALLIGSAGVWRVLAIVTAFTVAHSFTVSLAGLGLVRLPAALIEPAIAASIAWVAVENIYFPAQLSRRWLVGFLFGLVHGFGFAAALSEVHLTGWVFARALIGFNLGVEAGQALAVLAAAPAFIWLWHRPLGRRYATVGSAILAAIGAGWMIERIFFT